MAGSSSRRAELLDMIEAIVADELSKGTQNAARRISTRIALECGGQNVYFPKDRVRRDAKIYAEYTGNNISDLALRYRLSMQTVYNIISSERARRRLKQAVLPGMAREGSS